ncbi:MAG: YbgC/FadM family acyl-CoA thioesterase [Rubrivivax sp.]|nr:YbgC/FadM family acyl-CoA thioesterase [Rubrivivax sp.]
MTQAAAPSLDHKTPAPAAPAGTAPPQRADFRFLERLRVRWAEVDMQKIVFNGHYLMYFDTAVAGYWRALAMPYHQTMEALQGDLYARKATVEYEDSARYDDVIEVGVRCARIGRSSMLLALAVLRGGKRLVHGELVYVFADPATQTSRPLPAPLREVLEAFEAGLPMVVCTPGDWKAHGQEAARLRRAVFEAELGAAQPMGEDAADADAVHVLARNRLGLAVGTGRLVREAADGGRTSRIGRLAVLAQVRGAGIGAALVAALVDAAKARGDREIVLSAQVDARPFYERLGFTPAGAPFDAAGLAHQEMRRPLSLL